MDALNIGSTAVAPPRGDKAPPAPRRGEIALVGAGPGDPDLLTVKARRLIDAAEIVLHDELVSAAILDLVPVDAERVDVGKTRGNHRLTQDSINQRLVDAARRGKRVVRLKGGDPALFARAGEEIDFLRRHGYEPAIVPGVTAALGCAAALGMPLTDRRVASAVTVVAGQGRDGEPAPDWRRLAGARRTIVVYMGRAVAAEIAAGLIDGGMDPRTPVAVIENGTRPEQRVSTGGLGELSALAARHASGAPTLIVIGDVVRLARDWAPAEPAWTAAW
ncbi:MAG: uroporphyrinogen-III C-methyltransferase [Alphaproteobacteria bacterium]|nr:uroporphyrinogen-III C-methyltransferase [Alphaproteobacteria bacterium]